jgi:radical SAM protein with 4Fe4S-binding SPASM domain
MGKKTKSDREQINRYLEIQMNLANDLASRNPILKPYLDKNPQMFISRGFGRDADSFDKDFERLFHKIYGDIFPFQISPVLRDKDREKTPYEMILRIDLNYTKDEIIEKISQFIDAGIKNYKKNRKNKFQRKTVKKWQKYLEIWDLKNGDPMWIKCDDGFKFPGGRKVKKRIPWTYEEIAKYIYPKMEEPDELEKAIDKVKKDYRAAYKLIYGERYNHKKQAKRLSRYKNKNTDKKILCDRCPVKNTCEHLCPNMVEHLGKSESKRQHLLVKRMKKDDLNQFAKSKKEPTAEQQFDKFK